MANPAHHPDASAPGEAPPQDPPETRAKSETWETTPDTPQRAAGSETLPSGHNGDDDCFNAFMESCMDGPHKVRTPAARHVRPEQRCDHAEDTPLTIPRQGHLQREYTALGHTGHGTAAGDGHAAARRAADQTTDEHGAQESGARVEAGTNTASEPTGSPLGTAPPWGRGHLDYARLEGDASRPSDQAEQAAARDLGLWIPRLTAEEQFALAVRLRWLLTWQSRHLAEGTRTMADITIGHRTGHTPPATMNHPGQWHYVATWLMAHMGANNPDEMNGLHCQWHQHAALRIRATLQEHNIWDIPGSPGYQGHASGHQLPRSQDVPEPLRQAARRNSPERPRGPPPGMGSPSCTYRSPLLPFAPRRSQGSLHTSGMQGGTPEQRQGTRNPGSSPRRSCTPSPAARRVVFHEGMDRDHGGHYDPHPNRHHLPPIPDTGPRGPAPNRRTSPPFSRQSSASDRQRFTRAPAGQQMELPAHPPPPSQGRQPTRCQGDHTPRTHGQGSPRPTRGLRKGWGDSPPTHSPAREGR